MCSEEHRGESKPILQRSNMCLGLVTGCCGLLEVTEPLLSRPLEMDQLVPEFCLLRDQSADSLGVGANLGDDKCTSFNSELLL